jgi:hypothetical protein
MVDATYVQAAINEIAKRMFVDTSRADMNHQALSSFIWSVADLLRGDYKQSDYGKARSRACCQ